MAGDPEGLGAAEEPGVEAPGADDGMPAGVGPEVVLVHAARTTAARVPVTPCLMISFILGA